MEAQQNVDSDQQKATQNNQSKSAPLAGSSLLIKLALIGENKDPDGLANRVEEVEGGGEEQAHELEVVLASDARVEVFAVMVEVFRAPPTSEAVIGLLPHYFSAHCAVLCFIGIRCEVCA